MAYNTTEDLEIMGDYIEEVHDWAEFEADMEAHPWDMEENEWGRNAPIA